MTDPIPVLECKGLSVSYFTRTGAVPAVVDFDLRVMPGEAVGIVGESGCGKSTVALAIMQYLGTNGGIVGGRIMFRGRDMTNMGAEELRSLRGAKIAMVYQEPMASLNPSMKIGAQLAEVLVYHENTSNKEARARSRDMLDAVRLADPARIMDAYPHQLSGGQQQRVVIAMALLSKPELLLLDEPTTSLDVTVEAGIVDLIKSLAVRFGTSMVYISHNLGLILETCDRVTVMYSGEAVEEGTVAEVFDRMRHPYTQGLFASIPQPGTNKRDRPLRPIGGQLPLPHDRPPGCNFGPSCDFFQEGRCDAGPLAMHPVTHNGAHHARCIRIGEIDWAENRPDQVGDDVMAPGEVVLEVEHLKKYYAVRDTSLAALVRSRRVQWIKANDDITFDAREAETLAIVGESGCGKSTFARVLMGLESATSGAVRLHGHDLAQTPVQARQTATVRRLQMIFQNPFDTLNPSHSIGSQIARVIRKFGTEKDPMKVHQRVFELLDLVKLPREFANRYPRQLSGGQKQRIGIARAFAGNPAVVVADEPVSALDVSVQAAVIDLLMDIQRTFRTTLLFISHDLSVVHYLADRVVVMYLGQIVERGSTEQVFQPPYHPYTEALLSSVPIADKATEKRHVVLNGDMPSSINLPSGCPFQTRCERKIGPICEQEMPPEKELTAGHTVRCHLGPEVLNAMVPVFACRPVTP